MTTDFSKEQLCSLLNACGDAEICWHLRYAAASGDFNLDESEEYTVEQCQTRIDHYRSLRKVVLSILSQVG